MTTRVVGRTRYVEVPAQTIRDKLTAMGFEPFDLAGANEEVWDRYHERDRNYKVRVFTSIPRNAKTVRPCGADAIRVVALRRTIASHTGAVCISKQPRVYRTGSVEKVLERIYQRCRDAYAACNERIKAKQ